jgi:tetratricopeptide (TPR) repeat protein
MSRGLTIRRARLVGLGVLLYGLMVWECSCVTVGRGTEAGRDFFISYTQADRAWAEWMAWVLEEDQHSVLIQAWDFVPGSNWVQGMRAGVSGSVRTIAVLSEDYLASAYGTAEWQAAWRNDPLGAKRKLLMVRVKPCDRSDLLAGVVSVDLFGISEAEARARLRRMVSAAVTGRAKPAKSPAFPGLGRAIPVQPQFPGALPRVWKVPARNPNFTGRGADLAALATALAAGPTVTVKAVRGMGGVGKTQLAAEFAYGHAADYDLVYWLAAEQVASIPDQFTALAAQLGLDPVPEPEGLQAQVHDQLRHVPGWLLIFDNADSVDDLRPWLPGGPMPPGGHGHVIVTTRRGGFAALGEVMDLDVITPEDALALLRTRVPGLDEATGNELAEEFGCLPLALEQAAAYLDRTGLPAGDYLRLLRRRAADLYARGQVSGRADKIATLWDLSLERIAAEDPAATQLLDLFAYLAPERIPLALFTAHPDLLPEPLATTAADELAFTDALGVLVDFSLIKRTEAGLQIHRLLQGALRARRASQPSPPTGVDGWVLAPIPATNRGANPLGVVLGSLRADAPKTIEDAPQNWPQWAMLLTHVLAATGHLEQTPRPQTAAGPDAAWLLDRAAAYLRVHARLQEARPQAERALAIAETVYGPDHPDVGIVLKTLAGILRDLGLLSQARPLAERALAIDEAAYGPDHPTVATDLNTLAQILRDLGLPGQARPLAERALAIDEATYGPDHSEVGMRLNNLAMILRDLGLLSQARPLAERALAIDEAAYGPDHPTVATVLNNLAMMLRDLGLPGQARPLAERALAIDEATYGPDHPTVATVLNNLAMMLRDLGPLGQARPLAERALAIAEAAYGPDHPTVAAIRGNLALILHGLE